MGDLAKHVLIPTFDLCKETTGIWGPKYLHNFDTEGNDKGVSIADAAKRSSAAPTYFQSYQGFVDGGMMDNNPSMSALAKAVKIHGPAALSSMWLLSVGTGINPHKVEGKENDWGLKQWLKNKRLLDMLFDGMLGVPDYQCAQFLGRFHPDKNPDGRYLRIDVALDEVIELSDTSKAPELLALAQGQDLSIAAKFVARAKGLAA